MYLLEIFEMPTAKVKVDENRITSVKHSTARAQLILATVYQYKQHLLRAILKFLPQNFINTDTSDIPKYC